MSKTLQICKRLQDIEHALACKDQSQDKEDELIEEREQLKAALHEQHTVYFKDGLTVKLENRRVTVGLLDDGTWVLNFKRLGKENEEKIVYTTIQLTDEAMYHVIEMVKDIREANLNPRAMDESE